MAQSEAALGGKIHKGKVGVRDSSPLCVKERDKALVKKKKERDLKLRIKTDSVFRPFTTDYIFKCVICLRWTTSILQYIICFCTLQFCGSVI